MTNTEDKSNNPIVIKKYANRRLYNTATSSYVTLEDLSEMVKSGQDFVVRDAKTSQDITRSVLTQIIFEEEGKGQNLLPINFLRQLITFYGDSMQAFVPSYLEYSLDALNQEQEKMRNTLAEGFGGADPFRAIEEQTKRNVTAFQQAMEMFNPFAAQAKNGAASNAAANPAANAPADDGAADDGSDLNSLQEQMQAMQKQLEQLAKKTD